MNVIKLTDLDVFRQTRLHPADLQRAGMKPGNITEDTRIRAPLPSIKYCRKRAPRRDGHLPSAGRPKASSKSRRQP